jgi:hypothetical protein
MEKMPDKRFETGKALAEALKTCLLKGQPVTRTAPALPKASKNFFLFLFIIMILAVIGGGIYFLKPKPEIQTTIEKKVEPPPIPENVKLFPLKVESIPNGAQVFVDGTLKGQTPIRLDIPSGEHEVRLALPNYYDWEAQVQLKKEGVTPLLIRLIPITETK